MAAGTPTIASENVPHEVLIHGFTGFRVLAFDTATWVKYVKRLIYDENICLNMHRNRTSYVKKFDELEVAKQFL